MATKAHEVALDDYARNWLRIEFTTEGGQVKAFLAQYETTSSGKRVPVVRYDGVHGVAHRDLLSRQGDLIEKQWLPANLSFGEALQVGEQDIRANWRRYRAAFFRGRR